MLTGTFNIELFRYVSISPDFSVDIPPLGQLELPTDNCDGTIAVGALGMTWRLSGDLVGDYTFATLPAGFIIIFASWSWGVSWVGPNNTAQVTDWNGNVINTYPLQASGLIPSALDINAGNLTLHLVNRPLGASSIGYAPPYGQSPDFYQPVSASGGWVVDPFTYTIDPPNGTEVDADEIIRITSPGIDPDTDLDLSHIILSISSSLGACTGTIIPIIQTSTLIEFAIPASCTGAGPIFLIATEDDTGTQFSGSVTLGVLNVLLTNASGIYTLVPGKTNDTLYKTARDGTTRDVRIPTPFAKTGFIGG